MAKTQGKKKLIVIIAVVVAILLVVGAIYAKRQSQVTNETITNTTAQTDAKDDASLTETDDDTASTAETPDVPAVDPETLSSIAIESLGVTVYYSKGTPGFEYMINRTADSTQYADFTSADLVAGKCTDDKGLFVSIIKNPASESQTSISQTVKVGDDTYGLSLTGSNCTDNAELLTQYQTGFKNGFSSLSAL